MWFTSAPSLIQIDRPREAQAGGQESREGNNFHGDRDPSGQPLFARCLCWDASGKWLLTKAGHQNLENYAPAGGVGVPPAASLPLAPRSAATQLHRLFSPLAVRQSHRLSRTPHCRSTDLHPPLTSSTGKSCAAARHQHQHSSKQNRPRSHPAHCSPSACGSLRRFCVSKSL